ncbi:MAG: phytoene/squalene synthase family protein [Acidobacteria bacterium]|nr:phytoene/squalene synthase family protein [Acidobacteriota bacterium]
MGSRGLAESYAHVRAVTRVRAKNFYYAFVLLDHARRDSLCAIYAFMRHCDDLSDEPGAKAEALEAWRAEMTAALDGRGVDGPRWPAFVDTVRRYRIPHQYLHDMIDGVSSDLVRTRFAAFDELYRYCYQVASLAGLCVMHIFGYRGGEHALELAEKCGIAFQLTNILRDAGEDYRLGRIYFPAEDRARHGVSETDFGGAALTPALRALLEDYGARARGYYDESRPLIELVDPSCGASLWALIEIYSRLLTRIAAHRYEVLGERIRLSTLEKLGLVARGIVGAVPSGNALARYRSPR